MFSQLRTRGLACIACFLTAVSLTVVGHAERTKNAPPQNQQADKPVEQVRKNIQVLKGIKEAELYQLMNFMAVSLGELCTYCHVTKGKDPKTGQNIWVWESDDKPEKQAARRMLQMVMLINGSHKVDLRPNSVTCFTCHRGHTTPVGLPPMPLAKSGHEGLLDPVPPP